MQALELLQKTRELLTPSEAWTQAALARDAQGEGTNPIGDDAKSWCLAGALCKIAGYGDRWGSDKSVLDVLWDCLPNEAKRDSYSSLVTYNNTHSHEEVLQLIDKAIGTLEGQPCP